MLSDSDEYQRNLNAPLPKALQKEWENNTRQEVATVAISTQVPPRQHQQYQPYQPQDAQPDDNVLSTAPSTYEKSPMPPPCLLDKSTCQTTLPQENFQVHEESAGPLQKLPFIALPDEDEAEQRGLQWDPSRGMYVRQENLNAQIYDDRSPTPSNLQASLATPPPSITCQVPDHVETDTVIEETTKIERPSKQTEITQNHAFVQAEMEQPAQSRSLQAPQTSLDEIEILISQLLVETSSIPDRNVTALAPTISVENPSNESIQPNLSNHSQGGEHGSSQQQHQPPEDSKGIHGQNLPLLPPAGIAQVPDASTPLPLNIPRVKSPSLPPRPQSVTQCYPTPPPPPGSPASYSYPPPPPSPQPPQAYQQQVGTPSITPPTPVSQLQYHVPTPVRPQQPPQSQYNPQHYPPPPSHGSYQQAPLPQYPLYQPHQFQPQMAPYRHLGPQPLQHSYGQHQYSVSSIYTPPSASPNLSFASTVSSVSTPLPSYSTPASNVYDPYSSRNNNANLYTSPAPVYFPQPPIAAHHINLATNQRDYFSQGPPPMQSQTWHHGAGPPVNGPYYAPPSSFPNTY